MVPSYIGGASPSRAINFCLDLLELLPVVNHPVFLLD